MTYLKRLPINKLKIDQAFIRDLPDDEGVETKEQRDFIVANGCENIQRYFYSKPVPA